MLASLKQRFVFFVGFLTCSCLLVFVVFLLLCFPCAFFRLFSSCTIFSVDCWLLVGLVAMIPKAPRQARLPRHLQKKIEWAQCFVLQVVLQTDIISLKIGNFTYTPYTDSKTCHFGVCSWTTIHLLESPKKRDELKVTLKLNSWAHVFQIVCNL